MEQKNDNPVLLPELLEISKEYLTDEIKFDVVLDYSFEEDDMFNIEFILKNAYFENKFILFFEKMDDPDISPTNWKILIDIDDFNIIFNTSNGNSRIYSNGEYIYFKHHVYVDNLSGGSEMKILKNIAKPAIQKLIKIITDL